MATAVQELADSLTQDEIPIKLRCASCNKLVVNAFRLPCCDQNVCESCQTNLPDTCPVCMHTPLSADDCTPNKALRLTVKAFLKNEEKKRDKLKAEAAPPVVVAPTPPPQAENAQPFETATATLDTQTAENIVQSIENDDTEPADRPQTSGDSADSSMLENANANEREGSVQQDDGGASPNIAIITGDEEQNTTGQVFGAESAQPDHQVEEQNDSNQQQTLNVNNGASMGMNTAMNNGFSGFDPAMMQNATNGMNGMNGMTAMNGWNGFPNMMGMGMDPSMMMYGGFNGQGMGFNGMNMGMMGYDGGFGNWANQMGNGMNGNFGGANAGYYPNSGYNQQSSHRGAHFNQMSQQRNFPSNHRSGHGQRFPQNAYDRNQEFHNRAGYAQQNGHDVSMMQRQQKQGSQAGSVTANATKESDKQDADVRTDTITNQVVKENGTDAESAEKGDALAADIPETSTEQARDTSMTVEQIETRPVETYDAADSTQHNDAFPHQVEPVVPLAINGYAPNDAAAYMNEDQMQYNNLQSVEAPYQQGYNTGYNEFGGRGRGGWRGRGRGRGGFRGGYGGYANANMFENVIPLTPSEPVGQGVEGAPKGPKAMREGVPVPAFRGRGAFAARGGRGGGFGVVTNGTPGPSIPLTAASADNERTQSPVCGQPDGNGSDGKRSRSRTRSPSHHRSHRRRRSTSPKQDDHYREEDSSDEYRRSKKRRQSRKHDDDDGKTRQDSKYEKEAEEEIPPSRGAAQDSDSRHRSSRKHKSSHHDKDRSRSRDREEHSSRRRRHRTRSRSPRHDAKDDDESSRPRSRRHRERDDDLRSNGHRSRDRDHESGHDNDKDKVRERDRERERERERDHDRKSSRRDRDRDRSSDRHQHRSSRKKDTDTNDMPPPPPTSAAPTAPNSASTSTSLPPPTAPRGPSSSTPAVREFKIHGRSRMTAPIPPSAPKATSITSRSTDFPSTKVVERSRTESKPEIDPHTLEREARNRERMLKEAQRMSVLMNRGGGDGGGRKGSEGVGGRRVGRKERD